MESKNSKFGAASEKLGENMVLPSNFCGNDCSPSELINAATIASFADDTTLDASIPLDNVCDQFLFIVLKMNNDWNYSLFKLQSEQIEDDESTVYYFTRQHARQIIFARSVAQKSAVFRTANGGFGLYQQFCFVRQNTYLLTIIWYFVFVC